MATFNLQILCTNASPAADMEMENEVVQRNPRLPVINYKKCPQIYLRVMQMEITRRKRTDCLLDAELRHRLKTTD